MSCDLTTDALNRLSESYLASFPREFEAERTHLIKVIREFYRDKGTEDSYHFFFRAVYNESVELAFPGDRILRVSDGEWKRISKLRVYSSNPDFQDLVGTRIRGNSSNSTGVVETIDKLAISGFDIYDVTITMIRGLFQIDETIENFDNQTTIIAGTVTGQLNSAVAITKGTGFYPGEQINVTGTGTDAVLKVRSVNGVGGITGLDIVQSGRDWITAPADLTVDDAVIRFGVGPIVTDFGSYISERSRIDRYSVIQGNGFEKFSYIIKSGLPSSVWYDDVKKYAHPAGLGLSGVFVTYVDSGNAINLDNSAAFDSYIQIITAEQDLCTWDTTLLSFDDTDSETFDCYTNASFAWDNDVVTHDTDIYSYDQE